MPIPLIPNGPKNLPLERYPARGDSDTCILRYIAHARKKKYTRGRFEYFRELSGTKARRHDANIKHLYANNLVTPALLHYRPAIVITSEQLSVKFKRTRNFRPAEFDVSRLIPRRYPRAQRKWKERQKYHRETEALSFLSLSLYTSIATRILATLWTS